MVHGKSHVVMEIAPKPLKKRNAFRTALDAISLMLCSGGLAAVFLNIPIFSFILLRIEPWKVFAPIVLALGVSALLSQELDRYRRAVIIVPLAVFAGVNFLYKVAHYDPNVRFIAGGYFSATAIGIAIGVALLGIRSRHVATGLFISCVMLQVGIIADALFLEEYFGSVQPDRIFGRFAFTHTNPNVAAEALICATLMLIYIDPTSKRTGAALWLTFIPVILTFSRAGAIFYFSTLFWYYNTIRRINIRQLIFASIGLTLLPAALSAVLVLLLNSTRIENQNNISERMGFFTKLDISDNSSELRKEYIAVGVEKFVSSPIVGHFPGYSLLTTPDGLGYHNEFLLLGVEYGIVGVLLFLWMIYLTASGTRAEAQKNTARWFSFVLFGMGFFSHNILDSAIWITTYIYISGICHGVDRSALVDRNHSPANFTSKL